MTEFLNNFHFLRPWFLVLLIVPFFVYRHFFSSLKNVSAWENVCDKKLLNFLLIRGSSQQRSFIGYLAIIGLIGAVLALSGPTWQKKNMPSFAPENPVMLLLNLSSDMENTDITPNRLARAKYGISDLVKELKTQTGLIVYSDEPFLISPITEDNNIIINLLPAIGRDIMPENGDKLNRAIDMANLREFIDSLPQGIDTPAGECGNRLSGGQRQRIGIARALYKRADILFFDEATSSLDNATEQSINRAIEELSASNKDLTIVVVAHRDSSLDYCDRIVTLEKTNI